MFQRSYLCVNQSLQPKETSGFLEVSPSINTCFLISLSKDKSTHPRYYTYQLKILFVINLAWKVTLETEWRNSPDTHTHTNGDGCMLGELGSSCGIIRDHLNKLICTFWALGDL